MQGEACTQAVDHAIKTGYTHIDTAELYENEEAIGKVVKDAHRKALFLTSKVWRSHLDKDGVIDVCNASLKRLNAPYLDLYLIHWPDRNADYARVLDGFKALLDQKKIRSVGVSNFTIEHLKHILPLAKERGIPIVNNQVEYHPGLNQQALLDFCNKNNIVVTAYSPLGRAKWLNNSVLKKIGKSHQKSPAQVALRWALQKNMVVIPKASQPNHIDQNLDVFDFSLSPEELKRIDELGSDHRLIDPPFAKF